MALLSVSSNNNEQVVWGECAKAAESNPTVSRSPNSKPRRSRIPNRGRACWSTAGVNGPMHRQNWCADIQICDSLHTLESLPLCHWSALPSCGHTTMSKYTATTLCVYICLCVTEIGIQTGREMEVWAPVALYLSPNSHMKCRQGGKKVSSGAQWWPTSSLQPHPPKHLITSDSIITHEIRAIWFLYITSKGLVFYFKCASTPLRAGGMRALPPSFRNASFYSSSGSQLLIEAALISGPMGGFVLIRDCKSMYKMLSVL